MRIVVSGTHASGKSTLISDFALRHPEFTALPDPFESLDETADGPSAALFARQLHVAAARLTTSSPGDDLLAERGPLDFVAYLQALSDLTGTPLDAEFITRARVLASDAMRMVDVLVVLPLTDSQPIAVATDEHLELRAAMNETLLDLIDDPDFVSDEVTVVEIVGSREERVAALEALQRKTPA